MVELASLLSKLGYMDCHHPSASIYVFAELCLVTFSSVGEAGFVVCLSCLEGCGSQSNIGLFLIRCCYFCLIYDILDGTSSG